MRFTIVALTYSLALSSACGASRSDTRLPGAVRATSDGALATTVDTGEFLVRLDSGQIVIRSHAATPARVLAGRSDAALYDPALGLVWIRDGDRLRVIDLRSANASAVEVARGLPQLDRLVVHRGENAVQLEDGCDLPFIAIEWKTPATIEAMLSDAPDIRIDNEPWFHSQLDRTARQTGERREFSEPRAELPNSLLDCENADACGTRVAFGRLGFDLVLVVEKMGGDCWQRGCLLRDRKSGLFATPPRPPSWGDAKSTRPGPCGPYLFDHAQTSYLVDRRLCTANASCEDVGGVALGWLTPGDTVGAPGLGDFAD